jgi:hypothetical protein
MSHVLASELEHVDLGDARLDRRAQLTMEALARQPAVGATTTLTPAELEGFYRFVNNDGVSLSALLSAHLAATCDRIGEHARLVVAHDTTDFRFADEAERVGLGPMDNGGQGFYAHFSLAVGDRRRAFGVVGLETWTRKTRTSAKRTQKQRYDDPAKESLRWGRAVDAAECAVGNGRRLIHVMDREADDYDLLCKLVTERRGFVIRSSFDRRLVTEGARLKSFVRELDVRCERGAELSSRRKSRPAKARKLYPPRSARSATLAFGAASVMLRRPDKSKAPLAELTLNVVHVYEPSPPEGCMPIEWTLLTFEPIATPDQIVQVADDYRARWVIEEYFKALKTGCAYEKRQHESKEALLNALGLFIPIAWSLLNMRTLSRDEKAASAPAEEVLNPTQLQILRLKSNGRLPDRPTLGEAVLMMARLLGGLQPGNGLPGWQILGRAYERLLELEAGWHLAMAALASERSDR